MKRHLFLNLRFLLYAVVLQLMIQNVSAQCTGCTTTYTISSATNLTVSMGQTVCVNSGVVLSGQVFLNGGILCNNGSVTNLKLTTGKGTILNHGIIKDSEGVIALAGNTYVYAYAASQFSVTGTSFNLGSIDSLYFNTASTGTVTFANGLSISSRKLSINNAGYFSIGGTFNINNATLLLYNGSTGVFYDMAGSTSLTNTGNKKIVNTGTLTLNGMTIGGAGDGTTSVFIDNTNVFIMASSLQYTMTSGSFTLNNDVSATPQMTISTDLIISGSGNTLLNNGILTVGGNVNIGAGAATNNGTLICSGNFSVAAGTYTSSRVSNIGSSMIISSGSKVYDNGIITVGQSFRNTGKFKMGQQALVRTVNYYNTGTDTLIGVPNSVTDTSLFARISVTGISKNSGPMSGRLMVYDESLVTTTANIGFGFDTVSNTGSIGSGILYVLRTISPGNVSSPNPLVAIRFFLVSINNFTSSCGTTTVLTANLVILGFPAPYIVTVAGSSFTWTPGPLIGATQTLAPTTTTNYTVSVTYQNLVYSKWITGYVVPMSLVINSGLSQILFTPPDANLLTANITGGTAPYTYTWQPNSFFTNLTNNSMGTPQVNPPFSQSYTVSAKDAYGCPATNTVTLVAEPYANLNKIPDGGYYKVFNGKLLFKYFGQYASTALVCNIYDKQRILMTTGSFSSLIVNSGDNRYYYDATSLASGYYTMEVINEKKEKLTLRFNR